jgi:hypothetical protein
MKHRHVGQVSKNPRIDVEAIRNITYLHEFDRYDNLLRFEQGQQGQF